jgi:hypothetical protein
VRGGAPAWRRASFEALVKHTLGPHVLQYIGPQDEEGEIRLFFDPAPTRHSDIGYGSILTELGGTLRIESPWYSWRETLHGLNDIQLIYRLMWIADIVIQKVCADNGYELYKYTPGDVSKPFDIYN